MACHTKVGNTWREIDTIYTKVGSAWREVSQGWTKVGSTWRELDMIPPIPPVSAFNFAFGEQWVNQWQGQWWVDPSGTYTAPADGWYCVWAYGGSGSGGAGDSTRGSGGGGGGSAGIACSRFYLTKGQQISWKTTQTEATLTFSGQTIKATKAENGGRGAEWSGGVGGAGGTASGGNTYNWNGFAGGRGELTKMGNQGGNNGMLGGYKSSEFHGGHGGGGGGGGARCPGNGVCKYIYTGGMGRAGEGAATNAQNSTRLPEITTVNASTRFWGGGGGMGGPHTSPSNPSPGSSSSGHWRPAVIIERA